MAPALPQGAANRLLYLLSAMSDAFCDGPVASEAAVLPGVAALDEA